jgi:hypothetical protein
MDMKDNLASNVNAERRRLNRRKEFLVKTIGAVSPESFSDEELVSLLIGRPIDARRATRRAKRREQSTPSGRHSWAPHARNRDDLPLARRPGRALSRLNRSSIFPPLVPPVVEIEPVSVTEILAALSRDYQESPAHVLLDALATTSGLSLDNCAEILLGQGLILFPLDREDLNATQRARAFWNQFAEGRARYLALVDATDLPQFQGDWAYFDNRQLEALLPGIIIPTRLQREDYIVNYLGGIDYFSLDVYSGSNMAPLFQHQFLDRFNPLFFGKPRY